MSDRVEVRGLRLLGRHGALVGEQDRAQPFEVDLDLVYDMSAAGARDDLADAVDYGEVSRRVASIVTGRSFALLEALADAVGAALLEDRRVREVCVTVRKLRPPIELDIASVGVVRRFVAPER